MANSCTWPVDRSCMPESDPNDDIAHTRQQHAEDLAVSIMFALSGRQFGVCTVKIRPCGSPTVYPTVNGPTWLGRGQHLLFGDTGFDAIGCGCVGQCVENGPRLLHLPGPVVSIDEVTIADVILNDDEYVLESDRLYRRGAAWPGQRLDRPLGESGTWSVTYQRGIPVPNGVDSLTGKLAAEFVAACSGGKCKLPRRTRSVSRQGVSYDMVDPTDIYATGKTGIPEIDLWLSAVNPHKLVQPPRVI